MHILKITTLDAHQLHTIEIKDIEKSVSSLQLDMAKLSTLISKNSIKKQALAEDSSSIHIAATEQLKVLPAIQKNIISARKRKQK